MWAWKGIIEKAIAIVISGSGVGVLGINNLSSGGGDSKQVRSVNIKAGWGKEIYKKAENEDLSNLKGSSGANGWKVEKNGKYKWEGQWKYLGGDSKQSWWILKKDESECWGLVVEGAWQGNKWKWGGSDGTKKWRRIKGEVKEDKCKLTLWKKRWIYDGSKWTKEDNSVNWLR
ncbi:hypothetical protein WEN_02525 [Mycoplasma wenyonii str. Massachusetts]|uniref:Uncharacterized protein n=1 Tax=Mycoplasma wenyonii (strain Massachusetts) TaxID=1197325 RepID=I6ZJC6_MYCWM|nr:hypothetical protein [Mycoplasma wenyonii]AFN65290.1 hypothetical protein WEN_02525 [Mycoplasma wenyonii str. Massachusetts]